MQSDSAEDDYLSPFEEDPSSIPEEPHEGISVACIIEITSSICFTSFARGNLCTCQHTPARDRGESDVSSVLALVIIIIPD